MGDQQAGARGHRPPAGRDADPARRRCQPDQDRPGPTVTRYEIELAPGVQVNRVSSLSHDIAYLATPDVRILVPIPGKSAIGVEVPNTKRRLVSLGDILSSAERRSTPTSLTVGLGMDISGPQAAQPVGTAPRPHRWSHRRREVLLHQLHRHVVVDEDPPRRRAGDHGRPQARRARPVQRGAPSLTRVITNPKKANDALKWAVAEMDRRTTCSPMPRSATSRVTARNGTQAASIPTDSIVSLHRDP